MNAPWIQTVTGRALVLSEPIVEPNHLWTEIAVGLAHVARFAGQTDTPYSVAQHSVLMAEAALDETGDPLLAAHCLLHDGHEAYLGDRPSPVTAAIRDEIASVCEFSGGTGDDMKNVRDWLSNAEKAVKLRVDRAVWKAANLAWPTASLVEHIHSYDIRALATERKHLMLPPPQRWTPEEVETCDLLRPRGGRIRPWPPGKALERFSTALSELCPAAARDTGRDLVLETGEGL